MKRSRIHWKLALAALTLAVLACNLPTSQSATEPPTQPAATLAVPTASPPAPTAAATPVPPADVPTAAVAQPSEREELFAVFLVAEDDVLNVRSGAGVGNDVVDTLAPHATGLAATGNQERVGDSIWLEINLAAGGTGWVNGRFLTQQAPPDVFCNDPRVRELSERFVRAVRNQDGSALRDLVSPKTGLRVRHNWWNPEVAFAGPEALDGIFTHEIAHDWGVQDGRGMPITGSFAEVISPLLADVVDGDFERECNTLETGVATGGTAGTTVIPFEYANLNYIALFRAAVPGDELNWRTWAMGIEYLRTEPLIVFLVQYQWEI